MLKQTFFLFHFIFFLIIFSKCNSNTQTHSFDSVERKSSPNKIDSIQNTKAYIFDTTQAFPSIKELFKHKVTFDLNFYNILKTGEAPLELKNTQSLDSIILLNQELVSISLYKLLIKLPKSYSNFIGIDYLFNAKSISDEQKRNLFFTYPIDVLASDFGQKAKRKLDEALDKFERNLNLPFPTKHLLLDKNLETVDSKSLFNLNEGKNYLVLFGARWCSPCRNQEKKIQILISNGKIDTTRLKIIKISIDKNSSDWLLTNKEDKITWDSYLSNQGWKSPLLKDLHIITIPRFILVSNDRMIMAEGETIKDILNAIK